jgi:hypothetical protein
MSDLRKYITIVKQRNSIKAVVESKGELSEVEGTIYSDGAIIIEFANIYRDENTYKAIYDSLSVFENLSVETYLEKKHDELSAKYGDMFADVLMIDSIQSVIVQKRKISSIKTIAKELQKNLKDLCLMADTFCALAIQAMEKRESGGDNYFLYAMAFQFSGSLFFKVYYNVYPLYIDGNLEICDMYSISGSEAALLFDLSNVARERVIIKRCNNCGKYFKPTSRSDEIYCNNIYRNGKTCKDIGYEIKISRDRALSEYRKIYKTQNARKQRNGHIPFVSKRFDVWKNKAKNILEQCQTGEITVEEMITKISSDDWLRNGEI